MSSNTASFFKHRDRVFPVPEPQCTSGQGADTAAHYGDISIFSGHVITIGLPTNHPGNDSPLDKFQIDSSIYAASRAVQTTSLVTDLRDNARKGDRIGIKPVCR